jgi:hypothetical protein
MEAIATLSRDLGVDSAIRSRYTTTPYAIWIIYLLGGPRYSPEKLVIDLLYWLSLYNSWNSTLKER